MLKLKRWCVLLTLLAVAPQTGTAQETRQDQLEDFAVSHACAIDSPLPNTDQYLAWLEYMIGVTQGTTVLDVFAPCDGSPYAGLSFAFAQDQDESIAPESEGEKLLVLLDAEGRIQQGYGATEYVVFSYLACRADAQCFGETLNQNGYWARICPNIQATSPNAFELDLFSHGGDMRYLLPYVVTNCSLHTEANRNNTVFDVVNRIFQSIDGTGQ